MKARKRILDIRKHSKAHSNEDLWFYNDSSPDNQPRHSVKKTLRNDRKSMLMDYYGHNPSDDSTTEKSKKESAFIVDWQMSDAF